MVLSLCTEAKLGRTFTWREAAAETPGMGSRPNSQQIVLSTPIDTENTHNFSMSEKYVGSWDVTLCWVSDWSVCSVCVSSGYRFACRLVRKRIQIGTTSFFCWIASFFLENRRKQDRRFSCGSGLEIPSHTTVKPPSPPPSAIHCQTHSSSPPSTRPERQSREAVLVLLRARTYLVKNCWELGRDPFGLLPLQRRERLSSAGNRPGTTRSKSADRFEALRGYHFRRETFSSPELITI